MIQAISQPVNAALRSHSVPEIGRKLNGKSLDFSS
jgi:hypothetical protein